MSNEPGHQATTSTSYRSHQMRSLSPVPPLTHTDADAPVTPNIPLSPGSAKQILISYVRAEASQYALDLKQELENQNFSVYLVSIYCRSLYRNASEFELNV